MMDYTNNRQSPIARPQVVISMFDAAGQRIGEKPGFSRHNVLGAGQRSTILVLEPDPSPQLARYRYLVLRRFAGRPSLAAPSRPDLLIALLSWRLRTNSA